MSPLLLRLFGHPLPRDPALAFEDAGGRVTNLSYGDLFARVSAVAARLRAIGRLAEGAPVLLLAPPGAEFAAGLLGVLRAGGMAVPLAPAHPPAELAHVVKDAGAELAVATEGLVGKLKEAGFGGTVQIVGGDEDGDQDGRHGHGLGIEAAGADCRAIMLYTSGTTGKPKGVVLSHRAVAATCAALEGAWGWRRDDVLLHVLPLHHTHGLIVALLGALWAGATARFAAFEAARVWELLGEASVLMAVPTMYRKLLDAYESAPAKAQASWREHARRVRLFTSGSAALPAALFEAFREVTGQAILERYGMTEIGMALGNPLAGPRLPGTVGCPLPDVYVDIITEEGGEAAPGEPGELRVRSPQLFLGYHGDTEATNAAFDAEGRFRTGDVGTRDEEGVVRLLGRSSVDIIKSGGYKLSALDIEAALRDHPAVADVAVIGLADETWGERVCACVVPRPGASVALDDLQAFARTRLAAYKLPRELRLLRELPRNAMGKVQKSALK